MVHHGIYGSVWVLPVAGTSSVGSGTVWETQPAGHLYQTLAMGALPPHSLQAWQWQQQQQQQFHHLPALLKPGGNNSSISILVIKLHNLYTYIVVDLQVTHHGYR